MESVSIEKVRERGESDRGVDFPFIRKLIMDLNVRARALEAGAGGVPLSSWPLRIAGESELGTSVVVVAAEERELLSMSGIVACLRSPFHLPLDLYGAATKGVVGELCLADSAGSFSGTVPSLAWL